MLYLIRSKRTQRITGKLFRQHKAEMPPIVRCGVSKQAHLRPAPYLPARRAKPRECRDIQRSRGRPAKASVRRKDTPCISAPLQILPMLSQLERPHPIHPIRFYRGHNITGELSREIPPEWRPAVKSGALPRCRQAVCQIPPGSLHRRTAPPAFHWENRH